MASSETVNAMKTKSTPGRKQGSQCSFEPTEKQNASTVDDFTRKDAVTVQLQSKSIGHVADQATLNICVALVPRKGHRQTQK